MKILLVIQKSPLGGISVGARVVNSLLARHSTSFLHHLYLTPGNRRIAQKMLEKVR